MAAEPEPMSTNLFIAGDWGTSNLRLYLCEYREPGRSLIVDTLGGPGVSQVRGEFEEVFFSLVGGWIAARGALPIIISGMAGSTIGWKEAPYLPCPVDVAQLAEGRVTFEARGLEISIIAGLRANNPLGAPDVMRGEELQLLGWLQANGSDDGSARLFALPGTHNKWALLRQGRVETFLTAVAGELFTLLKDHSVLIADRSVKEFDESAFIQGVEAIEQLGDAHLVHALFATRSRQVLGDISPAQSVSYLSGLLVAADVIGAIRLFRKTTPEITSVTLIGEQGLSEYYRLVLDRLGVQSHTTDSTQIALAGYEAIYKYLYIKDSA